MSIPSGKLEGGESASERQRRCIQESKVKFFQTAAIIAGSMGAMGYIAHQQSPAFRRIPLPAKMYV